VNRRGTLRASDSDRDAIVERLHRAATEGRIASDELEQRVSVALKARTYAELDATVSDIPSAAHRTRARHPAVPAVRWVARGVRANPILLLVALPVLAVTFALLVAVTVLWATFVVVALVLSHRGGPWIGAARPRYAVGARGYGRPYYGARSSRRHAGGSSL
jgi:hypothetical protein